MVPPLRPPAPSVTVLEPRLWWKGAPPPPPVPAPRRRRRAQELEQEVLSLIQVAKSDEHLRAHFPKNPWCLVCRDANAIRAQCRRGRGNQFVGSPFGEHVTCDCVISAKQEVETINAGEGRGLRGQ
eukprot:12855474-Alexandrium_andersonii.AAC.1